VKYSRRMRARLEIHMRALTRTRLIYSRARKRSTTDSTRSIFLACYVSPLAFYTSPHLAFYMSPVFSLLYLALFGLLIISFIYPPIFCLLCDANTTCVQLIKRIWLGVSHFSFLMIRESGVCVLLGKQVPGAFRVFHS